MKSRVKRSELLQRDESPQSRSSSRSTTPFGAEEDESDQNVKPNYGFQYDFINPVSYTSETAAHESQGSTKADDDQNQEEQEYQFRLFTSAPQQQSAAQPSQSTNPKIRLSATPPPEDLAESLSLDKANFIRPNRPESYYFTSAIPQRLLEDLRSQYTQVALSTSDVLSRASSTNWPGTALPWRCVHVELLNSRHKLSDPSNKPSISVPTRAATKQDSTRSSYANRQRTRPSKKSRILLRRRLALRAELAAQAEKSDELERQKRTQRNREKKVKRKEREKRKKLDAAQDAAEPGQARQEDEQEDISMLDDDSKDDSQIAENHTHTPAPRAPAPAPVSKLDDRKPDETKKPPVTSTPKAPTAPRRTEACTKSSTPTKRTAPTARAVRVS